MNHIEKTTDFGYLHYLRRNHNTYVCLGPYLLIKTLITTAVQTVSISRSLLYVQPAFKFQYFRIGSDYIYDMYVRRELDEIVLRRSTKTLRVQF